MKKIFGIIVLSLTVLFAKANQSPIGLDVYAGASFPVSDKIRDALGGVWLLYGITPSETPSEESEWKVLPGLSFLSRSKDGNRVFLVRPTDNLVHYFGNEESKFRPYVILSAGPAYYNYAITIDGQRFSAQRIGLGGGAGAGILIYERLRLGVQFDAWSQFDHLNFNGLTVEAAYRIF